MGVRLDEGAFGKNNGSVQGRSYFDCGGERCGLFVRPGQVVLVDPSLPAPPIPSASPKGALIVQHHQHQRPHTAAAALEGAHRQPEQRLVGTDSPDAGAAAKFASLGRTHFLDDVTSKPLLMQVSADTLEEDLFEDLRADDDFDPKLLDTPAMADDGVGQDMLHAHRVNIDQVLNALRVEMQLIAEMETRLDENGGIGVDSLHSYAHQMDKHLRERGVLAQRMQAELQSFRSRITKLSQSGFVKGKTNAPDAGDDGNPDTTSSANGGVDGGAVDVVPVHAGSSATTDNHEAAAGGLVQPVPNTPPRGSTALAEAVNSARSARADGHGDGDDGGHGDGGVEIVAATPAREDQPKASPPMTRSRSAARRRRRRSSHDSTSADVAAAAAAADSGSGQKKGATSPSRARARRGSGSTASARHSSGRGAHARPRTSAGSTRSRR